MRFTRRQKILLAITASLLLLQSISTLAICNNAIGRNIRGSVTCTHGNVTGVFIEAERLPRAWPNGIEIQSGFAHWQVSSSDARAASFDYWLRFGGRYSVRLGCGPLINGPTGAWGTDNQTPMLDIDQPTVECDDPINETTVTIVSPCYNIVVRSQATHHPIMP